MTGVFALTFDTELIWGSFDHLSPAEFSHRYPDVRSTIASVLDLLERYDIRATWAVVGHLFLTSCQRGETGLAHPDLIRPGQAWRPGDWYAADPCTDRSSDPLWYGDDLLDAIQAANPVHEIGCHSFGHALFGDPSMTAEAVRSDLAACRRLAASRGIELRSFVFPRNREGHHAELAAAGFGSYRGADPTWFRGLPGPMARAAHLADQVAGLQPPTPKPTERLPGLWNIAGSSLLMDPTGARRLVSAAARLRKVRLGLRRAAATGGVLHLWTHPFNLASRRAFMLATLEAILREVADARARGWVDVETMGTIPERYVRLADA